MSLTELFSLDPLLLTDQQVDRIVEALRADRARWESEEKKPAAAKKQAASPTLSLGDLGLGSGPLAIPVKK